MRHRFAALLAVTLFASFAGSASAHQDKGKDDHKPCCTPGTAGACCPKDAKDDCCKGKDCCKDKGEHCCHATAEKKPVTGKSASPPAPSTPTAVKS